MKVLKTLFQTRAVMTLLLCLLTTMTAWAKDVSTYYIDADGTRHDVTATVLTGGGSTTLKGTYVVNSDISYTGKITLNGNVNIILMDGKKMTVSNTGTGDKDYAIYGDKKELHIYGQRLGTGELEVIGDGGDYNEAIYIEGVLGIHGGVVTVEKTNCSTAYAIEVDSYKNNNEVVGGIAITGGRVTVTGDGGGIICYDGYIRILGGQVTATGNSYYGLAISNSSYAFFYDDRLTGSLTLGSTNPTDFIHFNKILYSGYDPHYDDNCDKVKIADGQTLYDGTGASYNDQTTWETLAALTNVTLRNYDYRTVTFDSNGGSAVDAQTVALGGKATEPVDPTREGYTFGGWKNGEDDYDFSASVTSNLYLTAEWTPITYTVSFDANGGEGTMADMNLTYDGDIVKLTAFDLTAPEGKAFKNWNTAADGSGTSYDNEEWVRNLTSENAATVTLYAQWGKDIKLCTAEVPDQTLDGSYIYYKFENANWGNVATGTKVTDGDKVLVVGTDYTFGQVYFYGTTKSCTDKTNKIGDHFTVEIKGIGDYAGITTADFYIVSPEAEGTWGTLAWSINSDGDFSITGTGAMKETTQGNYDWYSKANSIRTITIGEGITSVAANAFAGTANVNNYGNVYLLTLPSTLTTIGENAFAYCTGLSIDLADLDGIDYPVNAFSYIKSITGTLYDNADNSKTIEMMAFAGSNNVTIKGRTLYKDGNWNTICLPFDVKADNALLTDATVKELDVKGYYDKDGAYQSYQNDNFTRTGFDNGTLYLYFKDATADSDDNLLKAGTPYLIKWDSGENITNDLTFEGVKLIPLPQNIQSADEKVNFFGTYSPVSLAKDDKSNLFLGDDNMLYYPNVADYSIKAFRGYFHVDLDGDGVRAINLNFGEEGTQTIIGHTEITEITEKADASWYTIDGIRLNSKPSKKGLYIHNGRKTVVK